MGMDGKDGGLGGVGVVDDQCIRIDQGTGLKLAICVIRPPWRLCVLVMQLWSPVRFPSSIPLSLTN